MPNLLGGVYAAALTPLRQDFSLDVASLPDMLDFLASQGCQGALIFGTTGEGPSFAPSERLAAFRAASAWRRSQPGFRLLAGTGTPSLTETIELTQAAFDCGFDGVVTLPPFYFRKVSTDGLFAWYSQVIQRAVPPGKALLAYHFPSVSGVPITLELMERLSQAFPERFAGLKDSSGDAQFARQLGEHFGKALVILTGNDRLFSLALENHASGCITAMANLFSAHLRSLWEAYLQGDIPGQASIQEHVTALRITLDRYPPFPPLLKALLNRLYAFPRWAVRPPLLPLTLENEEQVLAELDALAPSSE